MKLNSLTFAILLATSTTLISCGDEEKKPEAKKETAAAIEQQKAPQIDLAEMAKERYKNFIDFYNQKEVIDYFPILGWQDAKTVIDDYQQETGGATVKQTTTITPQAPEKPIIIQSSNKLTFSPELLKESIVTKVDFNRIKDAEEKSEDESFVDKFVDNFHLSADLLTDNNVKFKAKVNPFIFSGKERQLDFGGINVLFAFNEKDFLSRLGTGEWTTHIKPTKITFSDNESQFTLKNVDIHYALTSAGDSSTKVSPITFEIRNTKEEEKILFLMDGLEGSGKNIVYDPVLGDSLGESTGKTGEFSLQLNGEKIDFGHLNYEMSKLKNNADHYDLGGKVNFVLNGENLKKVSDDLLPLTLKNLTFSGNVKNFSPQLIDIARKFALIKQTDDKEAQKKIALETMHELLNFVIGNKLESQNAIELKTEQGDAKLDISLAFRGEKIDAKNWEALISEVDKNPMALLALKDKIDFKLDIAVSREILAAFGVAELVELQGAGMIENKDGVFSVHLENSNDGLRLNGQPLPF